MPLAVLRAAPRAAAIGAPAHAGPLGPGNAVAAPGAPVRDGRGPGRQPELPGGFGLEGEEAQETRGRLEKGEGKFAPSPLSPAPPLPAGPVLRLHHHLPAGDHVGGQPAPGQRLQAPVDTEQGWGAWVGMWARTHCRAQGFGDLIVRSRLGV